MAAPGPDAETYRKMSPLAKRIYWVFILAIASWIIYGLLD
jgi:hypothetical protein